MSDKELKELVASITVLHQESAKRYLQLQEEIAVAQKEIAVAQKEAIISRAELEAAQKEAIISRKEVDAAQKETARQINQVNKQLGELGNKWGTFAEGMAMESIKKILNDSFKIPTTSQRYFKRMNGEAIELDAFGYENSVVNTAVVVEIKSHLKDEAVEQLEEIMKNFPRFFPDHADKKLYGMIACVHAPENIKNILRKKGIYLAVMHDEVFELFDFKNFVPKDFNQREV